MVPSPNPADHSSRDYLQGVVVKNRMGMVVRFCTCLFISLFALSAYAIGLIKEFQLHGMIIAVIGLLFLNLIVWLTLRRVTNVGFFRFFPS